MKNKEIEKEDEHEGYDREMDWRKCAAAPSYVYVNYCVSFM